MKPADYKCELCGKVFERIFGDTEAIPQETECVCGGKSKRKWTPAYSIMRQGKCGNSRNGYNSNQRSIKKHE